MRTRKKGDGRNLQDISPVKASTMVFGMMWTRKLRNTLALAWRHIRPGLSVAGSGIDVEAAAPDAHIAHDESGWSKASVETTSKYKRLCRRRGPTFFMLSIASRFTGPRYRR